MSTRSLGPTPAPGGLHSLPGVHTPDALHAAGSAPDVDTIRSVVRRVLDGYPGVELAVLFGSVARGGTRARDVDIGVWVTATDTCELASIDTALGRALRCPVDVIFLNTAPPLLRDLFQCRFLTLSTNADNSAACTEALGLYDHIEATHYGDWTYPGCRSNDRAIAELVRLLGDKVAVSRAVHKTQSGLNKPCYRIYSGTVEFSRGVLYPCCSGSGAPMAVGITPSGNWREKIADLREEIVNGRPACTGCALAVAELGQKN